jgi:two-component system, NarL family, response regulator NreC
MEGPPNANAERKLRVLLVGSHSLIRSLLCSLINGDPRFEVCADAGDAPRARRICEEQKPDLIIFSTAFAPSGRAFGLLRDFRKHHPTIRFMVLSDHGRPELVERAFRSGANAVVSTVDECGDVIGALESLITEATRYVGTRTAAHLFQGVSAKANQRRRKLLMVLSEREFEIFEMIACKLGPSEISRELGISVKTVETHQGRIKRKLEMRDGAALHRFAERWGDERHLQPTESEEEPDSYR